MEIFESEKSVAHLLKENKTKSFALPFVFNVTTPEKIKAFKDKLIEDLFDDKSDLSKKVLAGLTECGHPDLLCGTAILASCGVNDNDDVFLPDEMWAAKDTPSHTSCNVMHDEEAIIGHIISSVVWDKDQNEIDASTTVVPDFFDIGVSFALYKSVYPEICEIVAKCAETKAISVSMEAFYDNFDYGLKDVSGNIKVVKRTKETAFLTKHLRMLGGDGKYASYNVLRVLRSFRFAGMGFVDKPANKRSEILSVQTMTDAELMKAESSLIKTTFYIEGKIMKFDTIEQAVEKIDELTKALDASKAELDAVKAKLVETETALSTEKEKVAVAEQAINENKTSVASLTQELDTAKAELAKIAAEKTIATRVGELEAIGVEVTEEKKKTVANMSDEVFKDFVGWTKDILSNKTELKTKASETVSLEDVASDNSDEDLKKIFKEAGAKLISSFKKTSIKNDKK
jgi:predicted  nucleic acid-binding Zn-ribbon protein